MWCQNLWHCSTKMYFLHRLKCSTLCIGLGCFLLFLLLLQVFLEVLYLNEMPHEESFEPTNNQYQLPKFSDVSDPVIVWWTPFTGESGILKSCGKENCFFTEERKFREHPLTKAVMFYGSKFDLLDLPLPRNGMEIDWALLHEESPKNTPVLSHDNALMQFNYTATFSRYSDFPLTLQYLSNIEVLTDLKYFVPLKMKNQLLSELAPVLYVQSDCSTPLDRDTYVAELMKYIPVDSYGACIQNKKLPPQLSDPMESMDADDFLHFVARYKFTLAFENSVCEDYITEKLWRPLIVGSVPIYMGSPSVMDWMPNNNSVILADNFKSPKDLAEYLLSVNRNDMLYNFFLHHKLSVDEPKVTNKQLVSALELRQWGIDNDFDKGNMVEHFECFICRKVHAALRSDKKQHAVANMNHYNCPSPVSSLTHKEDPNNWWVDQWRTGNCEALVLRRFIETGKNVYVQDEFYDELKRLMLANKC